MCTPGVGTSDCCFLLHRTGKWTTFFGKLRGLEHFYVAAETKLRCTHDLVYGHSRLDYSYSHAKLATANQRWVIQISFCNDNVCEYTQQMAHIITFLSVFGILFQPEKTMSEISTTGGSFCTLSKIFSRPTKIRCIKI